MGSERDGKAASEITSTRSTLSGRGRRTSTAELFGDGEQPSTPHTAPSVSSLIADLSFWKSTECRLGCGRRFASGHRGYRCGMAHLLLSKDDRLHPMRNSSLAVISIASLQVFLLSKSFRARRQRNPSAL